MAYIVDLTILMHRLSEIEILEERVISTLQDYARSGEIAQVHNDIRTFSRRMPSLRLEGNDAALTEIIRLIVFVQVPQITLMSCGFVGGHCRISGASVGV